jgi:hypothetical protein
MSQFEEAIEFYCKMLSNLEGESTPQEDTRLYTIAYFSFKGNSEVKPEMLLNYLQSNEKLAGVSSETMKSFVEKKIEEVNRVKYILSRIPGLLV